MSTSIVDTSRNYTPRSKAIEPPAAARAVWMIAVREVTEQLTSLRFVIITFLVVGLTPLAVYVGARDYVSRLNDYNRLETARLKAASESRTIYGMEEAGDLIVLRSLRHPELLSILVRGLDGALPQYWDYHPTGVVAGTAASQPARLADVLGTLDLEFLVRVALGLLAILLAFDAIAGEKELGTLRAVLSQPISRSALLAGKLVGGAITLILPLLGAFLVALITAQVFKVSLLDLSTLTRVGLLALTSALYLICFYALGLFVSSLASSQKTSLVFLLVIWVMAVLAVSPLATLIAQAIEPTQPVNAIESRKTSIDDDIKRQSELTNGGIYREVTGLPEGTVNGSKSAPFKDELVTKFAPAVVNYVNKRRQLLGEIDHEAEVRSDRQNSLAKIIMSISPAASFANAAADLAGTGDAHYAAWMDAARRHQSDLSASLFGNPPWIIIRNGGSSTWSELRKSPTIADLPTFVPPRKDAAAAFNRALPGIALLALFTGVFIAGGFIAFSRYDVR